MKTIDLIKEYGELGIFPSKEAVYEAQTAAAQPFLVASRDYRSCCKEAELLAEQYPPRFLFCVRIAFALNIGMDELLDMGDVLDDEFLVSRVHLAFDEWEEAYSAAEPGILKKVDAPCQKKDLIEPTHAEAWEYFTKGYIEQAGASVAPSDLRLMLGLMPLGNPPLYNRIVGEFISGYAGFPGVAV